jgi:ribonuclease D
MLQSTWIPRMLGPVPEPHANPASPPFFHTHPFRTRMLPPKPPPAKAEIAQMEPFQGLGLDQIFVVTNKRQAHQAVEELTHASHVGFDTESKPTFRKGQQSGGPHVFQFATHEKAFIFPTHVTESHPAIIELLVSSAITKIGFDLRGDLHQISTRFNVKAEAIVDLGRMFKKLGYTHTIGATSAVAMLFGQRLGKSKSVTTSNWAAKELSERQLLYAANDAFAAIRVFRALDA